MRANSRLPSGHERHAGIDDLLGAELIQPLAVEFDASADVRHAAPRFMKPTIAFISVDLPAPFAPMIARMSRSGMLSLMS